MEGRKEIIPSRKRVHRKYNKLNALRPSKYSLTTIDQREKLLDYVSTEGISILKVVIF